MKKWTEYRAGDEWPEGDNVEWEARLQGDWYPSSSPKNSWDVGYRIRFHIPEVKTRKKLRGDVWSIESVKQYYSARRAFENGFDAGWEASRENPEVD